MKDHRVVDVTPWVWEYQSLFKPLAVTEGVPVQASKSHFHFLVFSLCRIELV